MHTLVKSCLNNWILHWMTLFGWCWCV